MRYLRQSTAVEVKVGPFVDSTDGNTQETALTISQADVRLAKNGGDWAQKNETTTLVHEEAGWYRCLLDATDTNTVGILMLAIHESGALPVWVEFHVLEEAIYDALFEAAATGALPVSSGGITSSSFAAGAIDAAAIAANAIGASELAADAVAEIADAVWDELVADHVGAGSTGERVERLDVIASGGSGGLTNARAALLDNLDAAVSSRLATAGYTAPPSAAANADAVWDELKADHTTPDSFGDYLDDEITSRGTGVALDAAGVRSAVGLASANLDTQLAAIDDYVDAEVATILTRLGTPSDLGSGASVAANLVDIEAQTDDIGAAGAGLTAADDAILAAIAALNNLSQANIRTAVGLGSANLDAQLAALATDTAAILLDTGTDGVVVAAASKTGYRLSATGVDDVLDEVVEGAYTMRQFLRLFAAALLGKVSGAATNAPVFRDTGDSTNRISATTDADGNRSAVTLDAS